jgi:hypothetical protein
MIRWLIGVFIVLMLFGQFHRWLERIGLGRLPGDFRFKLFGREFFLPFASSVLICVVILLVGKFI